ncbi:hypothetical protein Q5512_25480 [Escherichia coli]|nr:hypothetical protein [Escherichia coli]
MKKRLITILMHLISFNILFFIFVFGGSAWDVIKSSYMLAPFSLSLIINSQVIVAFFLRKKGTGWVIFSSFLPPLLFSVLDFGFIIPSHPLIMFYQFNEFNKVLPRFDNNIINVIIMYVTPFFFLMQKKTCLIVVIVMFVMFFVKWNFTKNKNIGVKVLVVQTGMFLLKHDNIVDLRNEIFKHKNADVIIFSESPAIGFKEGSRIAFTRELLNEIRMKHDDKLYILNNYGLIGREFYNYNLSLYIMNGSMRLKAKSKLVPFWETPGLFYEKSDWESPYFSVPKTKTNEQYKFRNINIKSYVCYEAMFANNIADTSDLTIIQSNYELFKKGYDRVVKSGNVLAYVNKSSGFKSFISVQNMGGSIFVDNKGKFHWDVYETSKKKAIFLLEI